MDGLRRRPPGLDTETKRPHSGALSLSRPRFRGVERRRRTSCAMGFAIVRDLSPIRPPRKIRAPRMRTNRAYRTESLRSAASYRRAMDASGTLGSLQAGFPTAPIRDARRKTGGFRGERIALDLGPTPARSRSGRLLLPRAAGFARLEPLHFVQKIRAGRTGNAERRRCPGPKKPCTAERTAHMACLIGLAIPDTTLRIVSA